MMATEAAELIVPERLARLPEFELDDGAHDSLAAGACAMELVSWLADEPWSDHPQCVCPVIGAFIRNWNDCLPNDERTVLLRPILPKLIGTRNKALEDRRALMCADWLVRENTPAWLPLAGLTIHADALAALPEITSFAQVPSIRGSIEAARVDATAAGGAARDAAGDAARDAAGGAAWDAARDAAAIAAATAARDAARDAAGGAAWDAARDAAWTAAWAAAATAARDAAWDAARDAAGDAAWDAARDAARAKLAPTKHALQQSALRLVERMIALADGERHAD